LCIEGGAGSRGRTETALYEGTCLPCKELPAGRPYMMLNASEARESEAERDVRNQDEAGGFEEMWTEARGQAKAAAPAASSHARQEGALRRHDTTTAQARPDRQHWYRAHDRARLHRRQKYGRRCTQPRHRTQQHQKAATRPKSGAHLMRPNQKIAMNKSDGVQLPLIGAHLSWQSHHVVLRLHSCGGVFLYSMCMALVALFYR
jgi:hypothetical protein